MGIESYPSPSIGLNLNSNLSSCFCEEFRSSSIADNRRQAAIFDGHTATNGRPLRHQYRRAAFRPARNSGAWNERALIEPSKRGKRMQMRVIECRERCMLAHV